METFEATFPKDYRKDDIEQVLKFVLSGKFCQLICLPGGGKATVLKLLAYNQSLRKFHLGDKEPSMQFFYLNLLELPNLDQPTIDKFLLLALRRETNNLAIEQFNNDPIVLSQQLKETVHELITHEPSSTIVLLFDHFDEFQNKLPRSFFQTLRSLRSLAKYKFSCVFATRRDLRQLVDEEMLKEFYDFFVGNAVYMKLNDESAITFMLSQIEGVLGKKLSRKQKTDLTTLTDGHTKLTKVCAEIVLQENVQVEEAALLAKPLVKASLFELWLFLTSEEQKLLLNILDDKVIEEGDALGNLLHFGLLQQSQQSNNTNNFVFSIPLFEQFMKDVVPTLGQEKLTLDPNTREIRKGQMIISDLLSPQEYRLLKFLIENDGRMVEREEIVSAVWPEIKSAEGISEAAIDQMIFRLRKKIEDTPANPKHLMTVKGRGFRFTP